MSYSDVKPSALAQGRAVGMMRQDTGQLSLAVTSLLQCVWFLAVEFYLSFSEGPVPTSLCWCQLWCLPSTAAICSLL